MAGSFFIFSREMSGLFGQRWLMAIQIDGGHYGHSPTTKKRKATRAAYRPLPTQWPTMAIGR